MLSSKEAAEAAPATRRLKLIALTPAMTFFIFPYSICIRVSGRSAILVKIS
jgi:hypothetical protein